MLLDTRACGVGGAGFQVDADSRCMRSVYSVLYLQLRDAGELCLGYLGALLNIGRDQLSQDQKF